MKNTKLKLPSNKKFGYFFCFVFFISWIYLYSTSASKELLFLLAFVFFLFLSISIFNPNLLLPLNRLWMRLGIILGKIVSPIILGLIFFCLFTPYGIIMRIFGRDELNLKHGKKKVFGYSALTN